MSLRRWDIKGYFPSPQNCPLKSSRSNAHTKPPPKFMSFMYLTWNWVMTQISTKSSNYSYCTSLLYYLLWPQSSAYCHIPPTHCSCWRKAPPGHKSTGYLLLSGNHRSKKEFIWSQTDAIVTLWICQCVLIKTLPHSTPKSQPHVCKHQLKQHH